MELLYGQGYLSMGGDDEVARIVSAVEVMDQEVLDVGCGLGGAAITLTRDHGAKRVCGIDIDNSLLERADELVKQANLENRIELACFEPGPLPLADQSFDLVYLTAVSCHIQDLGPFFSELKRVIRPGGWLVGGEWYLNNDNAAYRSWDQLLLERGLIFYFLTRDGFSAALEAAGFEQVVFTDQTARTAELALDYLDRSENELKAPLLERMGKAGYAAHLEWTRNRAQGLADAGSGYGHFYAVNSLAS